MNTVIITLFCTALVLALLALIGVLRIKLTDRFSSWLNKLQDNIFKKIDQTEGLSYGCEDDHDHGEFKVSGSIVPIKGYITWYAEPGRPSKTISMNDIVVSVRQALGLIQPYMGKVRFKQVFRASEAQVVIGFYKNGDSGLPHQFKDTILAYAFLANNTTAKGIIGDMFFNERYKWAVNHGGGSISFKKVFLHEFLHSLGMFHQTHTRSGILYPTYTANNTITITQDTINGLKHLYSKYPGPAIETPKDDPVDPPVDDKPDCPPCPEVDCPECPECPDCPDCPDCPECPEVSENLLKGIQKELSNAKGLLNGVVARMNTIENLIDKS